MTIDNPDHPSSILNPFPNPNAISPEIAEDRVRGMLAAEIVKLESMGASAACPIIENLHEKLLQGGSIPALFAELRAITASESRVETFIAERDAKRENNVPDIIASIAPSLCDGAQGVEVQSPDNSGLPGTGKQNYIG